MAQIAKIRITADTSKLITGLKQAEYKLQRSGRKMAAMADQLMIGITAPFAAMGAASIAAFADLQKFENGLSSIMQAAGYSVAQVNEELENLKKLAQSPALSLDQAVKGSVRLQAVGFNAEQARETLGAVGNALALVGGGAQDLDSVTLAMSQIVSAGKVTADNINQIAERMPQMRAAMKAAFGTSNTEELQKLGITSEEFIQKITTELQKLPQAASGMANSIANARQSITMSFAEIGRSLEENFNISGKIDSVANAIGSMSAAFANTHPNVQKLIIGFAATAATIPLIIKAISIYKFQMASLIAIKKEAILALMKFNILQKSAATGALMLNTALLANPLVIFTAAVVAAGVAFHVFNKRVSTASKIQATLNSVQNEGLAVTAQQRGEVESLIEVIKAENRTNEEKAAALSRLKNISSEYFGELELEKDLMPKLVSAGKAYNDMLINRARIQAANAKLQELARKELELTSSIEATKKKQAQQSKLQRLSTATLMGAGMAGRDRRAADLAAVQKEMQALTAYVTETNLKIEESNASLNESNAAVAQGNKSIASSNQKRAQSNDRLAAANISASKAILDNAKTVEAAAPVQQAAFNALEKHKETLAAVESLQRLNSAAMLESIEPAKAYTQALNGVKVETSFYKSDVQKAREEMVAFNMSLNEIAQDGLQNIISASAEMAAGLIKGTVTAKEFGKNLLNNVLDTADKFADLVIKTGVAKLGLELALSAPFGGVAAIAMGGGLKTLVNLLRGDGFAYGGIVGGASFTGDKIPIRVNSGEMVLNKMQQGNLFRMINSGGGGGGTLRHEMRIKGSDLYYIWENQSRRNGRYT